MGNYKEFDVKANVLHSARFFAFFNCAHGIAERERLFKERKHFPQNTYQEKTQTMLP